MEGGRNIVCPSLEAQIANLADEITYYSHDLDDAVDFEILDSGQLEENIVWKRSQRCGRPERYPELREPDLHQLIIRDIIDVQVRDVIETSARLIAESGVKTADDVRRQPAPLMFATAKICSKPIARCGGFFTRMSIIIRGWRR